MWYYYGVHHDPHVRLWISGMRTIANMAGFEDSLVRAFPRKDAKPFEVVAAQLVSGHLAFGFRERWKTQISPDPVMSVFATNQSYDDAATALADAQRTFPEVWTRFEKLDLSQCKPFTRPSSAASPSSTSETAQQ